MRKERNPHESRSTTSTTQTPFPVIGRPRFSTEHPSRTEESSALATTYEAGVRDARTVYTFHHTSSGMARLHGSKAAVGNEVSKIASQILLAGFVGLHQKRIAWQHSYERDGIAQEEQRIQHDMLRCSVDIATLQAQIIRLDFELALL